MHYVIFKKVIGAQGKEIKGVHFKKIKERIMISFSKIAPFGNRILTTGKFPFAVYPLRHPFKLS